jgi:DNA-binding transcriptional ArsR family regulator
MPAEDPERLLTREVVKGAMAHPVRWMLATILAEKSASAAELAKKIDMPIVKVRRHLRAMNEEGVIEQVEERSRRGAGERFYATRAELFVDEEEFGDLTYGQRRQLTAYILKICLSEASRALVTKPTKKSLDRLDNVVVRVPLCIDEEGWTELAQIHREAYDRVIELRSKIAGRLKDRDEEGFRAMSIIMWFEAESLT